MINNPIMSNINWQTKTISFNTIYRSSNVQKCHICVDIMIIPSTCEIRKQSDKTFLSLNPIYENNNTFFSYLGGPGGALRRTQVNKNFRAVRPQNRADKFITRDKNNHQFFIYMYGPQCEKIRILGYSGGPGWPINNPTGPILLPRHPLTYINLHITYGSNPIRIF